MQNPRKVLLLLSVDNVVEMVSVDIVVSFSLTVGIVVCIGHSDSKIVDNVVDIEFSERTKLGFEDVGFGKFAKPTI